MNKKSESKCDHVYVSNTGKAATHCLHCGKEWARADSSAGIKRLISTKELSEIINVPYKVVYPEYHEYPKTYEELLKKIGKEKKDGD